MQTKTIQKKHDGKKSVFERWPCQASTGLPFDFSIYVLISGVAETRRGEVAGFSALASRVSFSRSARQQQPSHTHSDFRIVREWILIPVRGRSATVLEHWRRDLKLEILSHEFRSYK